MILKETIVTSQEEDATPEAPAEGDKQETPAEGDNGDTPGTPAEEETPAEETPGT